MTAPTCIVDLFPAFSLGGTALIGLMARIEPPAMVRWSTVSALALVLALYLAGRLHPWLPERAGVPLYAGLVAISSLIIAWNWRVARAARRR